MNLGRTATAVGSAALIAISLMGAKGCGGPSDPRPHPKPSAGKKFSCGYQIEGAGGHVTGTFDIGDDGKAPYQISVTPPVHKGSSFRCDAGSKMDLNVGIKDGQKHRLQCKLRQKDQQIDEDHAGTFISMTATNPHVHCQYKPLGQ